MREGVEMPPPLKIGGNMSKIIEVVLEYVNGSSELF